MTEQLSKKTGRPTLSSDGSKMTKRCHVVLTEDQKNQLAGTAMHQFGIPLSRFLLIAGQIVRAGVIEENADILDMCERFGLNRLGNTEADLEVAHKVGKAYGSRSAARTRENPKYKRVKIAD